LQVHSATITAGGPKLAWAIKIQVQNWPDILENASEHKNLPLDMGLEPIGQIFSTD